MSSQNIERSIHGEVVVTAPIEEVWAAWTTEDGIRSFFAPAGNIDPQVNGAYEIFFDLSAEPGLRGGEGMRFLALQPNKMLSFTWNAPPSLPSVRGQMTHVVVRLEQNGDDQTYVSLTHDGWGDGGEWDQAFIYFSRAWNDVVLPRLKYRFTVGPVDWDNPPEVG